MYRLRFCALAFFVTMGSAVSAQTAMANPDTGLSATDLQLQNKMDGRGLSRRVASALGTYKPALPCPDFCVPRRVTDPAEAKVGERDVLTYTARTASAGSRLRVDSRRPTFAMATKTPSAATLSQGATAVTRSEFRPGFDPVLAEPTTTNPE